MSPKRTSRRYSVSREDCQLDPENIPTLADGIKVKPVPCIANGKQKFSLSIVNSTDNIRCLDSLSEEIRMAGFQVSTVENMLNMLLDIIPKYIARTGHSLRIGNLMMVKPYATGMIEHANDALDPKINKLELRGTISPALRHSLTNVKLVNASQRTKGLDFVIREVNNSKRGEVDAESKLDINGTDIYVPPQSATDMNTRGKVWIETLDGRMLGRCAVLSSGPDMILARFVPDAPVDVETGRLVVETYGTKEAAEADDRSKLQLYSIENIRFV